MARRRLDEVDYYTLLSVAPDANADDIKAAFHRFARRYHPDADAGSDAKAQERRTRIYQRGTEAYRVLGDPERRRLYDAGLASGALRYDPSQARVSLRPTMPPGQASVRTGKARPFLSKAEQALRLGDFSQAELHLRIALQHEPGNPEIEARLALVQRTRQEK